MPEEMRELTGALRGYTEAADRLTVAVEKDGRRRDFWTKVILGFVAAVVVLVLAVAGLVAIVVLRQGESAGRGITIKDCVVPGGGCYAQVQEQRRADFERQTLLAVAVASCGQREPNDLDGCVRRSMAATDTHGRGANGAP